MKKAMIVTVGNTADPILKAIEEAHGEGEEVIAFLIYGRPFPGQNPSPFDVAYQAKQKAEELGVAVQLLEAEDPEDINACLQISRIVLLMAAAADCMIVNFTGGTKVLSAAIVHAALTESLGGNLVLDYTGGPIRDPQGRVLREAMRVVRSEKTATEEQLRQVLDSLQRANYREAHLLAERLPELGRSRFVKQAVEALCLWDEFDYMAAYSGPDHRGLCTLQEFAKMLSDDRNLAGLAGLVDRLREPGKQLNALVPVLNRIHQGKPWIKKEVEQLPLMVADALENSRRRLQEGRPTDSVLRAYRAVEVAVQARLLQEQINPWHPQWQEVDGEAKQRYLGLLKMAQPPIHLSLFNSLKLLEAMEQQGISEDMYDKQRSLQGLRNDSYLEHGYQRLTTGQAQHAHSYAEVLCAELLGGSLEGLRESVRHDWRTI